MQKIYGNRPKIDILTVLYLFSMNYFSYILGGKVSDSFSNHLGTYTTVRTTAVKIIKTIPIMPANTSVDFKLFNLSNLETFFDFFLNTCDDAFKSTIENKYS